MIPCVPPHGRRARVSKHKKPKKTNQKNQTPKRNQTPIVFEGWAMARGAVRERSTSFPADRCARSPRCKPRGARRRGDAPPRSGAGRQLQPQPETKDVRCVRRGLSRKSEGLRRETHIRSENPLGIEVREATMSRRQQCPTYVFLALQTVNPEIYREFWLFL